jgi:hypothetical protein
VVRVRTPPQRRARSIGTGVLAALLLGVLAFLVYASTPMTAEAAPLHEVRAISDITVTETADSVVLSPVDPSGIGDGVDDNSSASGERGLVFFAGARVEPSAYAAKLSGVARAGMTVVIVRPVLGFGILEWRPFDAFTALAPGVDSWLVGGHSLGGVRACQYIADRETNTTAAAQGDVAPDGLVLIGSYCAADVADSGVAALSISGGTDGLSTPDKIADARHLLPTSTAFVEIAGANHASFGDYGVQPGDGAATADDADVTDEIARAVAELR